MNLCIQKFDLDSLFDSYDITATLLELAAKNDIDSFTKLLIRDPYIRLYVKD